MAAKTARQDDRTGPVLSPAAPAPVARPAGAMPLDPLVAMLSRAVERSSPAPVAGPSSRASG